MIVTPQHVHNMAWGDDDGKTLYLAARSGLYRMRLNIEGVRPRVRTGSGSDRVSQQGK
jgi:gluconolactonase